MMGSVPVWMKRRVIVIGMLLLMARFHFARDRVRALKSVEKASRPSPLMRTAGLKRPPPPPGSRMLRREVCGAGIVRRTMAVIWTGRVGIVCWSEWAK